MLTNESFINVSWKHRTDDQPPQYNIKMAVTAKEGIAAAALVARSVMETVAKTGDSKEHVKAIMLKVITETLNATDDEIHGEGVTFVVPPEK